MPDPKRCATCGRSFAWRARWARDWDHVRHCSERCRRQRTSDVDADIERTLLALVDARGADKTICPSEVARRLFADDWRPWMERVRQAGRRLAARGEVEFRQGGRAVDPDDVRGAVRLARPRRHSSSSLDDTTRR
ncbi:MAG: DUF2256 and DUF3253 domain-containing protein [Sandaracinus sp.]|nr:DUF2256 and DUF3253 domain-containing protein [Sandaracinus sp.]